MRRIAFLLAAPGLLLAQAPIALEAPIERVRLHPDEAWITRVGEARVTGPGTSRFLIKDLPPGLRLDDLRVNASGPQGSRLGDLAVSAEVRVVTETAEYKALVKEREGLRDRRDAREAEGEASVQELSFLKNLQATYDKDLSARLTSVAPNPAAILELSKGLRSRMGELLTRDRARKRELEKLSQEESRLDAELSLRAGGHHAAPSQVSVEFNSAKAGNLRIELSYRSRGAQWQPAYEARLSGDRKQLELVLFAAVTQRSGESWDGVKLEISNARAGRSLAIPRYAGAREAGWVPFPPPPATAVEVLASSAANKRVPGAVTAQNTFVLDDLRAAEEGGTQVLEEAQGLATTFTLDGVKDVPSDGEPHRFRVLAREIAPELHFVAVPRLDPSAFQVTRFSTPAGLPLFPGAPIVQYAGTQRLGQTTLQVPAAGKPFELGFGPYRGLRVSYQRLEGKKETVGAFTKERQWTLRERFDASNDTQEVLELEIQDRVLRSAVDQLKVSALPECTKAEEKQPGVNTWILRIPPAGTGTVALATLIRAPQDGVLTGLEDLRLPQ